MRDRKWASQPRIAGSGAVTKGVPGAHGRSDAPLRGNRLELMRSNSTGTLPEDS